MFPLEIILIILRYCHRSSSLFCVNKTFRYLCGKVFYFERRDLELAIYNDDVMLIKRILNVIDLNSIFYYYNWHQPGIDIVMDSICIENYYFVKNIVHYLHVINDLDLFKKILQNSDIEDMIDVYLSNLDVDFDLFYDLKSKIDDK